MLNDFFTGFTRITGTEINGKDRTEVYKVSAPSYKWVSLPEKRYLFEKQLSKHCIRAYREIYVGVGETFEAVLIDASNNETRPSAKILEARPETTSDLEATKKLAGNFTAKIDELTRQNLTLMTDLEQ